ncbi:MAG TPA: hypothetical protein VG890_05615 [Puia sp.]|nr:hypothetical protein [Puia sp.]
MKLFNRLIRTDLILLVALLVLLVASNDRLRTLLEGFIVALLFISIADHIQHYRQTKKLY